MEESSKKKLVKSTWAAHVEKLEMKNWQREQIPRKWRGVMEVRKTEIAMGDCIKSDLERGGEEWENG